MPQSIRMLSRGISRNIFSNFCKCQNANFATLSEYQKEIMKKGLPKKQKIPGAENVIIVASAKGGVGKSTTAVNLALALSNLEPESDIGLLDLDVFGPSIPTMMNLTGSPRLDENDKFIPLVNFNVKCMSMGFLVDKDSPIVWRGPMVMSGVQKLLFRTAWGSLKYLILDLPPGTGDTQLSISQLIQVTGAVIVSTPQEIALGDARRGAQMFRKVQIPVLGCIQNMSIYICPKCGHTEYLFGKDGTKNMATQLDVPFLGDIPLDLAIRTGADEGTPVSLDKKSVQAQCYHHIAEKIISEISKNERIA